MIDIFSPVWLGDIALANRVAMAPMTRNRAGARDEPTAAVAEYYRQRADAGLIVTEGVQPSIHGKGYYRTPGIHSPVQVEAWGRVAQGVKDAGGSIVMQVMHCGRVAAAANKDAAAETVGPSPIRSRQDVFTAAGMAPCAEPRPLGIGEIPAIVEEHAVAARNARAAGLDGVELHCASGYLPMQFLSSNSNGRGDAYGGPARNRVRFVVETLEAMAAAIGAGRVGFRIAPGNRFNDMNDENPEETYTELLRAVDGLNLAYVHVINGVTADLDPLALTRANWRGAVIANNELTLESARRLLDSGTAQAISFGRAFIGNPDLVTRFREGAPLAVPDRATFYTGEDRGFIDYPALAEHRRALHG